MILLTALKADHHRIVILFTALKLGHRRARQKVEQVKAYFSAVENHSNPLHESVKDTKGCRLGRGKSWMGQAEDSILHIWQLTELKQTKEWERYPNRFRLENLGKHCQEWPAGKTESQRTLMAQSPKTIQGGASLSSKV